MNQGFASQTSPCGQGWAQLSALNESRGQLQCSYVLNTEKMSLCLLHPIG